MQSQQLQRTIMRRVYYTWLISLATHPVTVYTTMLFMLGWWLKELVFVSRVWDSFVQTPVGEVVPFIVRLVTEADVLTVVVTVAAVVCFVRFVSALRHLRLPVARQLA